MLHYIIIIIIVFDAHRNKHCASNRWVAWNKLWYWSQVLHLNLSQFFGALCVPLRHPHHHLHHLCLRCTSKQTLCVKWDELLLTVINCGTGHKCCISICLQSTYFWMKALNQRSVTSAWVNFSPFWTRTLPPGSSTQCEDTQLRSWEERIIRSPKSQLNVMCTASGWCSWNWSRVDIRSRTRKVDRTCSPST